MSVGDRSSVCNSINSRVNSGESVRILGDWDPRVNGSPAHAAALSIAQDRLADRWWQRWPGRDHAITGVTPRARGGAAVRIWRLPFSHASSHG